MSAPGRGAASRSGIAHLQRARATNHDTRRADAYLVAGGTAADCVSAAHWHLALDDPNRATRTRP